MKPPTVYDVAARAGVSTATVSRVFRRPDEVREGTRERVMAAVRDLGYVPSASAAGLAARRTGVLGLYLPGFDPVEDVEEVEFEAGSPVTIVDDPVDSEDAHRSSLYFDEVVRGSEFEARRRGFALMVAVSRDADVERGFHDIASRVDGLAVLAQSVPLDLLRHVARRVPVVLIAGPERVGSFDHVSVSNSEGMRALTEHLISVHDVREPVYLGGPADSPDDAERHRGFADALRAHDIDPGALDVIRAGFSRVRARAVAEDLVAAGRVPRALVCGNDQMGLGVLEVLRRRRIAVPDDVIVTGFDGIDASQHSAPRLTTVQQPMLELGRSAVRVMLSRIERPEQAPIAVRLPVRVLLRESSEGRRRAR
jgi:LacI family transcriptional regulator